MKTENKIITKCLDGAFAFRRNISKKAINSLFIVLSGLILLMMPSCGENKKDEKKVTELTNRFFAFARDGMKDSLLLLYPKLDLDLIRISTDSIKINSVAPTEDGQYEVALTNYFSFDNTEESNIKTNISLFFEKKGGDGSEFVINDSKGFVNKEDLPLYVIQSGCINNNQKYTDREYSKRLEIAKILVKERAKEIASEIENNIEYEAIDHDLGWWPLGAEVLFSLENKTDYTCTDFTVYITIDYSSYNNGTWKKEFHRGDISANYKTYFKGHSIEKFKITFNENDTKLADTDKYGSSPWFTKFFLKKIEVKPEAVMCNLDEFFKGTEYQEYIAKNKEKK
jgi:hypothetical protein